MSVPYVTKGEDIKWPSVSETMWVMRPSVLAAQPDFPIPQISYGLRPRLSTHPLSNIYYFYVFLSIALVCFCLWLYELPEDWPWGHETLCSGILNSFCSTNTEICSKVLTVISTYLGVERNQKQRTGIVSRTSWFTSGYHCLNIVQLVPLCYHFLSQRVFYMTNENCFPFQNIPHYLKYTFRK